MSRVLLGYVVRLEAPGEEPRWSSLTFDRYDGREHYGDTNDPSARCVMSPASYARLRARRWRDRGYPHARAVPVYLTTRGRKR